MITDCKPLADLAPGDLAANPIWEFALDKEGDDDGLVRPVVDIPADHLDIRLVGTKVCFANGTRHWALIENVDPKSALKTLHLLSLSLFHNGSWIHLDRYHDYNLEQYGPAALARKLELGIDHVFPISYDIRDCCVGDPGALAGVIESDPKEKLSRGEIFNLIVGKKPAA
jgi:hypothetical protein